MLLAAVAGGVSPHSSSISRSLDDDLVGVQQQDRRAASAACHHRGRAGDRVGDLQGSEKPEIHRVAPTLSGAATAPIYRRLPESQLAPYTATVERVHRRPHPAVTTRRSPDVHQRLTRLTASPSSPARSPRRPRGPPPARAGEHARVHCAGGRRRAPSRTSASPTPRESPLPVEQARRTSGPRRRRRRGRPRDVQRPGRRRREGQRARRRSPSRTASTGATPGIGGGVIVGLACRPRRHPGGHAPPPRRRRVLARRARFSRSTIGGPSRGSEWGPLTCSRHAVPPAGFEPARFADAFKRSRRA